MPDPAGEAVLGPARADAGSVFAGMIRLARPHQWAKSVFVVIGPVYHLQDPAEPLFTAPSIWGLPFWSEWLWPVVLAAAAFAVGSSGLYVLNDVADAEEDRQHPRKRLRPVASGRVPVRAAKAGAAVLFAAALGLGLLIPGTVKWWVLGLLGLHALNVTLYSARLKRLPIVDVLSLSLGFVIRVLAGCVAIGVAPTTFLLNATLFVSMFLAFGKRLGERRTLGSSEAAARARGVQTLYSDHSLRMLVVATGVATLLIYLAYVAEQESAYLVPLGIAAGGADAGAALNLLWLTTLPAAYGLFRCFLLVERGDYDDPTELAIRDRPFQAAALLFAAMTGLCLLAKFLGWAGGSD